MSIPFGIREAVKQIGMLELLDASGFDEVLGYVTFERSVEIDQRAGDSIRLFPSVWDTASVHSVPVFYRESNTCVTLVDPSM